MKKIIGSYVITIKTPDNETTMETVNIEQDENGTFSCKKQGNEWDYKTHMKTLSGIKKHAFRYATDIKLSMIRNLSNSVAMRKLGETATKARETNKPHTVHGTTVWPYAAYLEFFVKNYMSPYEREESRSENLRLLFTALGRIYEGDLIATHEGNYHPYTFNVYDYANASSAISKKIQTINVDAIQWEDA